MQKASFRYYDLEHARKLAKEIGAQTISEMMFSITKLGLVEKGELLKSLRATPQKSEFDEIDRIKFKYNFYGVFLDVGTKKIKATYWRNSILNPAWIKANEVFNAYYAELIQKEIAEDAAQALDANIKIRM
jgi:hypothetical protein